MARIAVKVNGEERVFEGQALEPGVNLEEAAREAIVYLGKFLLKPPQDPLDKQPDVVE